MLSSLKLGLNFVVVVGFLSAAYVSYGFSGMARWFPLSVAIWGAAMSIANLVADVRRARSARRENPEAVSALDIVAKEDFLAAGGWLLWIVMFAVSMFLAGVFVGTAVWMTAFFAVVGRYRWRFIVISVAITVAALFGYGTVMNLQWPPTLLPLSVAEAPEY